MWSQLKHQVVLLIGALMAFAYSIAMPCAGGSCTVAWVSATGIFLLLFAIGKRRWPIPITMLILMVLLQGCQGPLPNCELLPVCLPCRGG